jgi:GxxExxY protein
VPISISRPLRRLSQKEFGEIAYETMRHVFDIHRELGRFFEERIYKNELAYRLPGVQLEVPIDITFGAFSKRLCLDVLVGDGAVFEFKAVEKLANPHRAQLIQYLLLGELAHGKLVNMRPPQVEHEFVNTTLRRANRTTFEVHCVDWPESDPELVRFREFMVGFLRDLGTGLTIPLYEEAAVPSETRLEITTAGRVLGEQRVRLITPEAALRITTFDDMSVHFESHARRWLAHTRLRSIAWVNIAAGEVTFRNLKAEE